MTTMKLLITGFEPYCDYPVNSSWVVAEKAAAQKAAAEKAAEEEKKAAEEKANAKGGMAAPLKEDKKDNEEDKKTE